MVSEIIVNNLEKTFFCPSSQQFLVVHCCKKKIFEGKENSVKRKFFFVLSDSKNMISMGVTLLNVKVNRLKSQLSKNIVGFFFLFWSQK